MKLFIRRFSTHDNCVCQYVLNLLKIYLAQDKYPILNVKTYKL